MIESIKEFLHREVPVSGLCLYRIMYASFFFWEVCYWVPHTTELFSNQGYHATFYGEFAASPEWSFVFCIVLLAALLCVAVGLFTRVSLCVVVVLLTHLFFLDYVQRSGMNAIGIIIFTILIFSDCHKRFSLDAILFRKKREVSANSLTTCIFWQRLIQFEIFQIYFLSGLYKLWSAQWVDGTILLYALTDPAGTQFGIWVTEWMSLGGFRLLCHLIIIFELIFSWCLFIPRMRKFAIIYAILFHSGSILLLNLEFFAWHFILALLILFPDPHTITDFLDKIRIRNFRPLKERLKL